MNRLNQAHPRSIFSPSRRLGLLGVLVLMACGAGSITFTPEEDDAIMTVLESTWAADETDGLQLSLCEDRVRSDAWDNPGECVRAHVVRGGGRGLAHEEDVSGGGCGGCPFGVLAYVQGTISGGPFSEPVPVAGEVYMGDLYDVGSIFSYPHRISLGSTGDVPAFYSISGELQENGQIDIKVYLDQDMQPDHELTLSMRGAATCTTIDE